MPDDTIIPFPLNPKPSRDKPLQSCPLQAQAELRLTTLHKLLEALAQAPADSANTADVCLAAGELLRDVSVFYGRALAKAEGRARHAKALQ